MGIKAEIHKTAGVTQTPAAGYLEADTIIRLFHKYAQDNACCNS